MIKDKLHIKFALGQGVAKRCIPNYIHYNLSNLQMTNAGAAKREVLCVVWMERPTITNVRLIVPKLLLGVKENVLAKTVSFNHWVKHPV